MRRSVFKMVLFFTILAVVSLPAFAGGNRASASAPSGSGTTGYPEYLNIGDTWPVVKPGHNVTLRILTGTNPQFGGKTEDLWYWKWVDHKMNIKVSVEQVLTTAMPERKALLFAAGDLPDLAMELPLTTTDIINYGTVDKQIYDISKLLNNDLTPNMLKSFERVPEARTLMTTPDGGIYTFPLIAYPDNFNTGFPRVFINTKWLADLGLSRPNTLDELYNVLKTFKEKDPSGTGRIIPFGGTFRTGNPYHFILAALGFAVRTPEQMEEASLPSYPALRDGKVVIPAGSPLYREFLTYMNKLYTEGLMDPDFFTADSNQTSAKLAEKRVGSYGGSVYHALPNREDYNQYEALSPVSSHVSSQRIVTKSPLVTIRGDVMSATTKYPEVVMRFMDYLYTEEGCLYHWNGPTVLQIEDTFGMYGGFMMDPNGGEIYPDVVSGKYSSPLEVILRVISPFNGRHGDYYDNQNINFVASGLPRLEKRKFNPEFPDSQVRVSLQQWVAEYGVDFYPNITYLSVEDNTRLADLQTVIMDFVNQETAKFITGANPLSNFDRYINELNALGLKEYEDLYIKAFNIYQANMK